MGLNRSLQDLKKKDVLAGLGEIGFPLLKIMSKGTILVGYDTNSKLVDKKKFQKYQEYDTRFLHICIPHSSKFVNNIILLIKKFNPECIIIHSTVSPYTTETLQKKLKIPVIYSATRGVHKRMINDMKKYTKFYSIYNWAPKAKWAVKNYVALMKKSKVKTKRMSSPIALELAKIVVDTSYYGWLINYAQISKIIAEKNKVDFDEMWTYADEIHRFLGNRPKMYPGFIGGHCVIPNLELIKDDSLYQIDKINNMYSRKVKNSKLIRKKYEKSTKKISYDSK